MVKHLRLNPDQDYIEYVESFEWSAQADCRGIYGLFVGSSGEKSRDRPVREARAKSICAECVVIEPCLDYAIAHREFGVWGGLTEDERHNRGYPIPARSMSRKKRK